MIQIFCLNILFALAYLDNTYVEFLIDKLAYFKEAQVEKGKKIIFFSAKSLLPLVVFLYGMVRMIDLLTYWRMLVMPNITPWTRILIRM